VGYALALTVATHWPELRLATPVGPAPDKLAHMLAFGGLAFLLLTTRWLRSAWQVGLVLLAWTALDEVTQGLPFFRRSISWQDLAAGQIGVLLAVVWWWALGPIGGRANRTRLALQAFILGDLFRGPGTWIVGSIAAAAGAIVIGFLTWIAVQVMFDLDSQELLASLVVAALAGAVAAEHGTLAAMCRRRGLALERRQPCFECGGSCCDVSFDAFGRSRCPSCGGPIHRGQWSETMDLPLSAVLRGALGASLVAVGLFFGAVFIYGITLALSARVPAAKAILQWWQRLSPDMQFAIDVAGIALILATAVRLYRLGQSRVHDLQHVRCRGCGHDLTQTPIDRGIGRCGECGTPFVRFPHQPAAVGPRP
jgi:hypothetical protein